jgi:peptidyl-dipeptidase Dcp
MKNTTLNATVFGLRTREQDNWLPFADGSGKAAQLRYFLIEPEYRGIGLGSKLMTLYMDFLRECGYRESYLWTTHELDTAAFLYKRVGFKLIEEKESSAFGKPLREQRYNLVLP